jgi:hypothetical protein
MSSEPDAMAQVQRERVTDGRVRAFDASDIVDWIHELEDEIAAKEEAINRIVAALEDVLGLAESYLMIMPDRHGKNTASLNEARAALAKARGDDQ